MLHVIKIEANTNGSHDDQIGVGIGIAKGWAIVPEGMQLPDTYPFVDIEVEEIVEDTTNEDGEKMQAPTGTYIVTSMMAGIVPEPEAEPEPREPEPTQMDRIEAQVTYTAMMTDTMLEV